MGHGEFGTGSDFILMGGDKLMGVFGGLIHVLGARLILVVCGRTHLKPCVGIGTIVICLILLATVRIEAVVIIALVVGLVI
jgi:hypothetical protein